MSFVLLSPTKSLASAEKSVHLDDTCDAKDLPRRTIYFTRWEKEASDRDSVFGLEVSVRVLDVRNIESVEGAVLTLHTEHAVLCGVAPVFEWQAAEVAGNRRHIVNRVIDHLVQTAPQEEPKDDGSAHEHNPDDVLLHEALGFVVSIHMFNYSGDAVFRNLPCPDSSWIVMRRLSPWQ